MLNRKKETIISTISLALLAIVFGAVFYIQADYDLERLGVVVDGYTSATAGVEAVFTVSAEFEPLSAAEVYTEGELFEKINGKAPLYTSAGFERLTTQRFTFITEPEVWIEIYRFKMSSPKAAYCVYSTQKRPSVQPVASKSREHSYKTSSGIYLAAGSNYFEIITSAENEAVLDALAICIADIAHLQEAENALFELPKVLPDDGAVGGSFKLYLNSAFGIDGLGEVFVRNYETESEQLTVFLIKDGKKALSRFETFMTQNGIEKISDQDGIVIYDLFGVYELITLTENGLIGVHEAFERDNALTILKSIRKR
jgi:hypothetical protein